MGTGQRPSKAHNARRAWADCASVKPRNDVARLIFNCYDDRLHPAFDEAEAFSYSAIREVEGVPSDQKGIEHGHCFGRPVGAAHLDLVEPPFATLPIDLVEVALDRLWRKQIMMVRDDALHRVNERADLRRRPAVAPPTGVRGDIDVLRDLARRLGCGEFFDFLGPREVFEEFRRVTAGGVADYAGITYDRIRAKVVAIIGERCGAFAAAVAYLCAGFAWIATDRIPERHTPWIEEHS